MFFRTGRVNAAAAAVAAFIAICVAPAGAQILKLEKLDPKIVETLPAKAREHYTVAWDLIDRIAYEPAYKRLEQAVAAAPTQFQLRYLAVDLARYLARTKFGSDSEAYYTTVIGHLETLSRQPLPSDRMQRVRWDLDDPDNPNNARSRLRTLDQRDELRKARGMEIARSYARRVYGSQGETDEDIAMRAVRDAIRKADPSRSLVEQVTEAMGGGQPRGVAGMNLPAAEGTGPGGMTGLPADADAFSSFFGGGSGVEMTAPAPLTEEPSAAQFAGIEASLSGLVREFEEQNAVAAIGRFTEKAQPVGARVLGVFILLESKVEYDPQSIRVGGDLASAQGRMTVLDDATGVRFWLRESSGDWRIWALEKTGLPAAPDDFVDLEKLSESLGPMGDIVRKSIAASIPPERLTEPASPEQQAEIETTVRTMLVASDDLEAKTYVSMYTPEARPMAETIQHTYPPPGTTYDYGPAKVSGDEAQMEVTWRATGQPERTFLFSLRRISEGWRVVGNGVLPAEYVNYELMSGIMDETERLMSSRLGGFGQMPFGAPPAATPPPLAQGPVDPGSLDGKVYTNAQLGLTVTVPDGWRPIFGSELEGLINVGISQSYGSGSQEAIVGRERLASGRIRKLLAVARDAGANAPIQEHLFIEGQNLPPVGRAMSASEILKVMRDAVENSGAGAKIDPTPEEKTIDGREFAVLRVTFDLQGMTLTQERHFAVVNDRLLAIDLSFMTQEQRGDLEAVLQGIKIAPPLP